MAILSFMWNGIVMRILTKEFESVGYLPVGVYDRRNLKTGKR
jgi:hypothetical protein